MSDSNKGNIILYSRLSFILHVQDFISGYVFVGVSLREASIISSDSAEQAGRTRRLLSRLPPHLNPLTQCLCSKLDEKSHEGQTHKGAGGRRGRALVGWIELMCLSAFLGEFARPFAPRAASQSEKMKN